METVTKLINVALSTETIAQITRTDRIGRQTRKYAEPVSSAVRSSLVAWMAGEKSGWTPSSKSCRVQR